MIRLTIILIFFALISDVFGYGGVIKSAEYIAQLLFILFLFLVLISFCVSRLRI
jgi:uncharacterized membrane protein YtjA (UPF0391 family)